MTKENIFLNLKPILAQSLSRSSEEITLAASLADDLGADSMDIAQTATDIEDVFDLRFSDSEIEKMKTVQDIVDVIATHKLL